MGETMSQVAFTSLPLSRELFRVLPDSKTEYAYHWDKDSPDVVGLSSWCYVKRMRTRRNSMCPAWQVHELLQELTKEKQVFGMCCGTKSIVELIKLPEHIEEDVFLVEALGKLRLWVAKQKEVLK